MRNERTQLFGGKLPVSLISYLVLLDVPATATSVLTLRPYALEGAAVGWLQIVRHPIRPIAFLHAVFSRAFETGPWLGLDRHYALIPQQPDPLTSVGIYVLKTAWPKTLDKKSRLRL